MEPCELGREVDAMGLVDVTQQGKCECGGIDGAPAGSGPWMVSPCVGSVLLSGELKFSSHRDHRWGAGGVRLCLTQTPQVFPIKMCRRAHLSRARLLGPGEEGEAPLGSGRT